MSAVSAHGAGHLAGRPLFSVVVPTRGRAPFLAEAVASVLAQTCTDLECIVVADGDGELGALPADPRLRLVRRPQRGGAAAARNSGIQASRGRMVAFLDDDDVYLPDRLASAAAAQGRAPVLVGWRGRYGQPQGPAVDARLLEGDVADTILDAPVPHVGTCSIERGVLVPFAEDLAVSEDVEWWLRQARRAPVSTVAAVGYLLREHDGERQTARLDERIACREELLRRHADYFATHPRAAAFHWRRLGFLAAAAGQPVRARQALWRSLTRRPDWRTAAHLVRAWLPRAA